MTLDDLNAFCAALPATTHVVQWGGSDVWKVGGKVFAIASVENDQFKVSFKVTPVGFEILRDHPDCIPAPYLASRGMTWIQARGSEQMSDDELRDHLRGSYDLIAAALPKKLKRELGLME
ncbi:MmcQ/YjbR family DNA-binding protein [Asticcacaulis sp. SL142]|uniref:MmcQ/YjbR family DNA-binding protein n=1 Tax=Asticcacaulis sp. SL142 TaxID=2995155 RepID=UPI00226D3E48|nr:MmcQ/YjbR family DNA-binding protein [Asticcacaulis sp. SL142]WAC48145.1 MmcQ/YjbR family DNA-binding protein [Asticcacaulis sp. SL142]